MAAILAEIDRAIAATGAASSGTAAIGSTRPRALSSRPTRSRT